MKFGGVDGFDEEKLKTFGNVTRECHNREVAAYKMLIKFNNSDIPFTKVCFFCSIACKTSFHWSVNDLDS